MAKRRRLSPALGLELDAETAHRFARETSAASHAPISAMAADAGGHAAAEEMAKALETARTEGRLAEALPLDAIVTDHLIRDRTVVDPEEMDALISSLRARGQQSPIEVEPLGEGRYGLISGHRRLIALRRLAQDADGPQTVLAFLRYPDALEQAYLAMIEENEIRSDLSFWERGRVVVRAVDAGVFPTVSDGLRGLFGTVSRAKRSKIGSFARLVQALEGVLRFPHALSEKLGLALAQKLKAAPGEGRDVIANLHKAIAQADPKDAASEIRCIEAWLAGRDKPSERAEEAAETYLDGIKVVIRGAPGRRRVAITGVGVDPQFEEDLLAWIEARSR